MFPDKTSMVRNANVLFVVFAFAPVLYLVIATLGTFGKSGFARDTSLIPWLFLVLAVLSLVTIVTTVFIQTSKVIMSGARYDSISRTFQRMSTGAVLSESHAIYGLVLTLLSGSIFYGIGFSIIAWASLLWVRGRFKQNLGKLPGA